MSLESLLKGKTDEEITELIMSASFKVLKELLNDVKKTLAKDENITSEELKKLSTDVEDVPIRNVINTCKHVIKLAQSDL